MVVFFFFFAVKERTAGEDSRPFSPDLFSPSPFFYRCFPRCPLLPLLLPLVKVLLARLCVSLASPFVKRQIFQYKVFPGHYNLG